MPAAQRRRRSRCDESALSVVVSVRRWRGCVGACGSFTVNASSASGLTGSASSTYTVIPPISSPAPSPSPSNTFSTITPSVSSTGVVALDVQTHAPGTLKGLATLVQTLRRTTGHGHHRRTHTVHKTVPYGTASASSTSSGVDKLTITLTAARVRLLRVAGHRRLVLFFDRSVRRLPFQGRCAVAQLAE